jgi:hypothetical protein
MSCRRRGKRAADEPAGAPQGDELATLAQPITPTDPNFQASRETAKAPDEADAFLRHLSGVAIEAADAEVLSAWVDSGSPDELAARLTRYGEHVAEVLAGEACTRWPALPHDVLVAGFESVFDTRLTELARRGVSIGSIVSANLVEVRLGDGSETIGRADLREFEDALDRAVKELVDALYDSVPAEYFDVKLDDAVDDFEWTLRRELARLRARKDAR